MNLNEYLESKKIDPAKFKSAEPDQYAEFQMIFDQVHPNSFTQQKLFLINNLRRSYKLETQVEEKKPTKTPAMRPKMKPLKPKTS